MALATPATRPEAEISAVSVSAYEIPTDQPESDATLEWESTTIIVVEVQAGDERGLGYTYGDASVARLIDSKLADVVEGADALSPPAAWARMAIQIRNTGRQGPGAMAMSAVDVALWDLRAKLLGVPLADALPRFHERVPIYGSGGFTSYSRERLQEQLGGWAELGIPRVKLKVGREPEADPMRIRAVREAVGDDVHVMVDANGAYAPKEAIRWANCFAELGIAYLEEPVSSEDLAGMRFVRERSPGGLAIAAGEYGWDLPYFHNMLEAGAVDILQADVTRCGGITNMLRVDGLCKARNMPFSAHCAPAISAHVCCAIEALIHLEYFHDHVRIERMLFDGTLDPQDGFLSPSRSRAGLGLELKRDEAERFEVS